MLKPREHETTINDVPTTVRFDYDRGQSERWNGLTGIGWPAIGPSVDIYEVRLDRGWTQVTGDESWLDRVEQEIIDMMIEREHQDGEI